MAKMTNAGTCPLILPDDRLTVVGVGDQVEVSKATAEIPGVAAWIKSGQLAPVKPAKKTEEPSA